MDWLRSDKVGYAFIGLLLFHSIGTVLFWILYFMGIGHASTAEAYEIFESAFPAADGIMAFFELLTVIFLLRKDMDNARYFGLIAMGMVLFLGMMDLTFNVLYLAPGKFPLSPDDYALEVFIEIITLFIAVFGMLYFRENT